MQEFMGQNSIILNVSLMNKSRLQRRYDLWEEKLQSFGQNLGDYFVDNVAKTYKSKLMSCVGAIELGNQSNKIVILASQQIVVVEKMPNANQNISFNQILIFLVKESSKTIKSRSFG